MAKGNPLIDRWFRAAASAALVCALAASQTQTLRGAPDPSNRQGAPVTIQDTTADDRCSDPLGSVELLAEVDEVVVTRERPTDDDDCDGRLPENERRFIGEGDTVEVADDGRALLELDEGIRVNLFHDSLLSLGPDSTDEANLRHHTLLERGTLSVDASTQEDEGSSDDPRPSDDPPPDEDEPPNDDPSSGEDEQPPGVEVETDEARIFADGGRFFVHADPEEMTWVVAIDGDVDVVAEDETVSVRAGSQTWVERNEPPVPPRPATRSVTEEWLGERFPSIDDLTNGHLDDDDVFAGCLVDSDTGWNLRSGPDTTYSIQELMPPDAPFHSSERSESGEWLFGETEAGGEGWANEEGVNCPYEPEGLPVRAQVAPPAPTPVPNPTLPDSDGDGWADTLDNCPFVPNPGQENGDGDTYGDACDAAPTPTPPDGDGDGIPDAIDICKSDPDPGQFDSDGDGQGDECDAAICIPGGVAVRFAFLRQVNCGGGDGGGDPSPPPPVDSDGDGLFDDEEFDYGTDPSLFDTDFDGYGDGEELFEYGTDPLDSSSAP